MMTREEAIKIIDCYDIGFYDLSGEKIPADKLADAFDMAIEALKAKTDGDLISRQGALAKIRTRLQDWSAYGNEEYRRGLYACEDMILSLPSAEASQDLAEPNKELKGSDLIRRADAIDAVWKIVPVETEIDSTLLDKAEVIVELSVLPSAEAVQGWIPVSEMLPKAEDMYQPPEQRYLCQLEAYGERKFCVLSRLKGAVSPFWDWYGVAVHDSEVIAWMPLPEPYGEDDEE